MNVKQLLAVATLLTATGSVMAQPLASGNTRAADQMVVSETQYPIQKSQAPSTGKTRAEVKQAHAAKQVSVPDAQYPRLATGGSKGGMAAPSQAVTDEAHQKVDPVYSGH